MIAETRGLAQRIEQCRTGPTHPDITVVAREPFVDPVERRGECSPFEVQPDLVAALGQPGNDFRPIRSPQRDQPDVAQVARFAPSGILDLPIRPINTVLPLAPMQGVQPSPSTA